MHYNMLAPFLVYTYICVCMCSVYVCRYYQRKIMKKTHLQVKLHMDKAYTYMFLKNYKIYHKSYSPNECVSLQRAENI